MEAAVLERSLTGRARSAAAVVVAGLVVVAASAAAPGRPANPQKPTVEQQLLDGTPLHGAVVHGLLDLSDRTMSQPFECTNCRFEGGLKAQDAVFQRLVNLSGSTFGGKVTMAGATFSAPALFGFPSTQSTFEGDADFTLASFGDLADFEGAEFKKAATFTLARFGGEAIFAGEGSMFDGQTSFDRASFGARADFRGRGFSQPADFARATFAGRSDFGDSVFAAGGQFNGARFGTETTFLGATFGTQPCSRSGEKNKPLCATTVFDDVRSAGEIDFASVKIPGTVEITNVDVAGLSFSHTIFVKSTCDAQQGKKSACEEEDGELRFENVRSPGFFIDISSLSHVVLSDPSSTDQSRREVLGLLETSAKSENNLALANDAHYRLQSLKSNDYWAPFHWLDVFFYQWIAGYLVRPDHPIFTLLALALLVSLLRVVFLVPEARPAPDASRVRPKWQQRVHAAGAGLSRIGRAILRLRLLRRAGARLRALWPGCKDWGHELLDTLRLIWPGAGAASQGRRFEAFAYRVLFVCMLIGFANSNPTLRQILDAVL